ncbi:hypothetical protein L9F63_007161 [Diploptera punctata]|uniref:Telomeric repeat-binding factor 2-interacting protein 1 n=1 Tax=Diploptera punctata TaxID=6984 RepID=A0AAD7Z9B2_DIPPU|nr:hypothetical protein L9F63_007161 [Diploptera punctata]
MSSDKNEELEHSNSDGLTSSASVIPPCDTVTKEERTDISTAHYNEERLCQATTSAAKDTSKLSCYRTSPSSDRSKSSQPAVISLSKRRKDYTKDEKMKILKYIINEKAYDSVKGRKFWEVMQARRICPGRTWQSMKEHFMKQIVPNINKFDIAEDTAERLKRIT